MHSLMHLCPEFGRISWCDCTNNFVQSHFIPHHLHTYIMNPPPGYIAGQPTVPHHFMPPPMQQHAMSVPPPHLMPPHQHHFPPPVHMAVPVSAPYIPVHRYEFHVISRILFVISWCLLPCRPVMTAMTAAMTVPPSSSTPPQYPLTLVVAGLPPPSILSEPSLRALLEVCPENSCMMC